MKGVLLVLDVEGGMDIGIGMGALLKPEARSGRDCSEGIIASSSRLGCEEAT